MSESTCRNVFISVLPVIVNKFEKQYLRLLNEEDLQRKRSMTNNCDHEFERISGIYWFPELPVLVPEKLTSCLSRPFSR